MVLSLGFGSELWILVSEFVLDQFSFINRISAIIQGFFALVIAKYLLKGLLIFFKASGLAKSLIQELPIIVLYYILL